MSDVLASVGEAALNAGTYESFVLDDGNGALVTFRGIVRNRDHGLAVTGLDYRAHPDAERFLRESCLAVAADSGLRVAAAHRVGPLAIGDTALIACVAAPHRSQAFEACARLVDHIKQTVPIWKRQHFDDGQSEWVGL